MLAESDKFNNTISSATFVNNIIYLTMDLLSISGCLLFFICFWADLTWQLIDGLTSKQCHSRLWPGRKGTPKAPQCPLRPLSTCYHDVTCHLCWRSLCCTANRTWETRTESGASVTTSDGFPRGFRKKIHGWIVFAYAGSVSAPRAPKCTSRPRLWVVHMLAKLCCWMLCVTKSTPGIVFWENFRIGPRPLCRNPERATLQPMAQESWSRNIRLELFILLHPMWVADTPESPTSLQQVA